LSFRLAHLSDAHIGPLPRPTLAELAGKRLTGYWNWTQSRSRHHDMMVLADLVDDLHRQCPDHVAMTGDILNIGLPAEFAPGRAWLDTLGTPHDVSFTPGNHDAYVRGSLPHLAATFAPFCANDGAARAQFPFVRIRQNVALIGLSSAIPTLPFLASGKLGAAQLKALAKALEITGQAGHARVIMIHHPPHRGGAKAGRGLADAAEFEATVARHGADLIIHGHNHRRSVAHLASAHGRIPIVGVASASAIPGTHSHHAAYHLFSLAEGHKGWHITGEARGLVPGSTAIGKLDTLAL
jgi:3',5'-cyclic AMP phosphodiesterase CpdA